MSNNKFGDRDTRVARFAPAAHAAARPERQAAKFPARQPRIKLSLEDTPRENAGFDPYNTSGSFDRSKNWERVGKR